MRVMFLVLAATTLLSGWWVQRTLPEPVHRVHRNHVAERVHRLPAFTIVEHALYLPRNLFCVLRPSHLKRLGEHVPPPYRRYLLASLLLFGGSTMVFTLLTPFLRDALQLHASLIFILSLVRMLAATLCFELAGRWEQHIGPKRVQLWAVGGVMFLVWRQWTDPQGE